MSEKIELQTGIGLDVGTAFIASARLDKEGKYHEKIMRNAFFAVPEAGVFTKNLMKKSGASTVEIDGKMYVIGNDAIRFAAEWAGELRRPMKSGVISSDERTSGREVFFALIKEAVGQLLVKGENCVYSIPAAPLNATFDVDYHTDVIGGFLTSLGYKAIPMGESLANVYANLADKNFSGVSFSFGAGMTNICAARASACVLQFAVVGAGDWIDLKVSQAVGISVEKAAIIKENGVDLTNPKNDTEQAIATYYRRLIKNVIQNFSVQFIESKRAPEFTQEVDIAITGGTSKAIGFDKVFSSVLSELKLPFKLGKIVVGDPDFSISRGCLIAAQAM